MLSPVQMHHTDVPQDIYEYVLVTMRVQVQRTPAGWVVAVLHLDGTTQVVRAYRRLTAARRLACRLAHAYAHELPDVAHAQRMARAFSPQTQVVITEHRHHCPRCGFLWGCFCGRPTPHRMCSLCRTAPCPTARSEPL